MKMKKAGKGSSLSLKRIERGVEEEGKGTS